MRDMWRETNNWLSQYLPPAVRWIFVVNILMFLFSAIFGISSHVRSYLLLLMETPVLAMHGFVWQFVTYMFMHANVMHLLGNMLILWFFAPRLEYRWGTREFLRFYFIVGIGAGVFHALVAYATGRVDSPLLGASGALYGVMLAYALYYPEETVLLYLVVPIKIKYLMVLLGIMTFMLSIGGDRGSISHVTHLGGLLVAFVYLKGGDWFGRLRRRNQGPRIHNVRPGRGQW